MKTTLKTACLFFLLCFVALAIPARQAHAYLDPGSGSYMLQLIVAGLAGFLISLKMFWTQIKSFIIRLFSKSKKVEQPIENKNDNEK